MRLDEIRNALGAGICAILGEDALRHIADGGVCVYRHGLWNNFRDPMTQEETVRRLKDGGIDWSWTDGGCVGFRELRWGECANGDRELRISEFNSNDLY